jgi:hypothetical protein
MEFVGTIYEAHTVHGLMTRESIDNEVPALAYGKSGKIELCHVRFLRESITLSILK